MPTHHEDIGVLNWASELEESTLAQAAKTAQLPFVVKPLALMPDAHVGFGSTVGSVIATEGAIIPSAIGVDIGCGMIAVETNLTSQALPDNLGPLHGLIREAVPAGMGKGHEDLGRVGMDRFPGQPHTKLEKVVNEQNVVRQFGTLGGGNHFVEICLDERDVVWVVLHSGSRGTGNKLAEAHIGTAKGIMKDYFISLPDPDLAYLVEGTPEFESYITDMLWAQGYALASREAMMDAVMYCVRRFIGDATEVDRINSHHNFTERENHRGRNLWITRKGAVRARTGDRGIIPGSMGTRSYIVTGLGNEASWTSCAHGAGRRLSRSKARQTLDIEGFVALMEGKTWQDRSAEELLDEDPRAYKDIDQVMEDQKDLVSVDHTLSQILNYKGLDEGRGRRRKKRG